MSSIIEVQLYVQQDSIWVANVHPGIFNKVGCYGGDPLGQDCQIIITIHSEDGTHGRKVARDMNERQYCWQGKWWTNKMITMEDYWHIRCWYHCVQKSYLVPFSFFPFFLEEEEGDPTQAFQLYWRATTTIDGSWTALGRFFFLANWMWCMILSMEMQQPQS